MIASWINLFTSFGLGGRSVPQWAQLCLFLLLVSAEMALLLGLGLPPAARAAANVVTNLNDSGAGSLRQAITSATAGDTITLNVAGLITLTSGELVVDKDLTLAGPGAASLSISGNQASISSASRVINNSANLTVSGLTLRDGEAGAGKGGAILNSPTGVLTISSSVITGSRAQLGGGIYNSPGGIVHVTNSTISLNQTRLVDVGFDASGAGLYNAGPGGVVTITGSTFYSNAVHDHGSGIFNESGAAVRVANSTFSLNQASGAGVISNSGSLQLNNVTITVNNGKKQPLGLRAVAGSVTTVQNSIIAGNLGGQPDCAGAITSGGYNIIGFADGCGWTAGPGDQLGTTLAPINPMLGPLRITGGLTMTHIPLVDSPAINAGSPALPGSGGSSCDSFDQRSVSRPQAGPGSSSQCDIGAVEVLAVRFLYLPVTR